MLTRARLMTNMRSLPTELGLIVPLGPQGVVRSCGRSERRFGSHASGYLRLPRDDRRGPRAERGMREAVLADEEPNASGRFRASGRSTAATFPAYAPVMTGFGQGRDFSAWLDIDPGRHSTGGKTRLSHVSKMELYNMRQLFADGAISVIPAATGKGIGPTAGSHARFRGCQGKNRDGRRHQDGPHDMDHRGKKEECRGKPVVQS